MASRHAALFAAVGGLVGLTFGIVLDGAVWLWAFASVLNGQEQMSVGPILQVTGEAGSVTASGGLGLLILPVSCAIIVAAATGLAARWKAQRRALAQA